MTYLNTYPVRRCQDVGAMGTPMQNCVYFSLSLGYKEFMLRQSRIDAPGVLHDIICRGIERRRIFEDDADRALGKIEINLVYVPSPLSRLTLLLSEKIE